MRGSQYKTLLYLHKLMKNRCGRWSTGWAERRAGSLFHPKYPRWTTIPTMKASTASADITIVVSVFETIPKTVPSAWRKQAKMFGQPSSTKIGRGYSRYVICKLVKYKPHCGCSITSAMEQMQLRKRLTRLWKTAGEQTGGKVDCLESEGITITFVGSWGEVCTSIMRSVAARYLCMPPIWPGNIYGINSMYCMSKKKNVKRILDSKLWLVFHKTFRSKETAMLIFFPILYKGSTSLS